jgi:hypothetical protein
MAYEIKRFPYDGTIDADGHILEPADLWETYLEKKYVDRALRIKVDEDGLEYLEINGKPSKRTNKGSLAIMGAMGEENLRPSADRRYSDSMPFGACNASERLSLMDQENLELCLLYPTIGLLWECELTDPELSLAYISAYNRWIADFCRESHGRLIPIAQLTLLDPEGSAAELERAVRDGCKGAWLTLSATAESSTAHPNTMLSSPSVVNWTCHWRFIQPLHPMALLTVFSNGRVAVAAPRKRSGCAVSCSRYSYPSCRWAPWNDFPPCVSAYSRRDVAGSVRCLIAWMRTPGR